MEGSQTIVFLNVGTSYLIAGGKPTDLLQINVEYRDYIKGLDVLVESINHTLEHEVFFLPLLFNRFTQLTIDDIQKFLATDAEPKITNQITNSTYHNFMEYNRLATQANHEHYSQEMIDDLPDPNTQLAMRQHQHQKVIFGEVFERNTEVFRKPSLDPGYGGYMDDRQLMSYMINLQRWIQKYWWNQSLNQVNPTKKQRLN